MPYYTEAKLFEVGDFISHAGLPLAWKIECDAIQSMVEWTCKNDYGLSNRRSSKVVGIPRGGLPTKCNGKVRYTEIILGW